MMLGNYWSRYFHDKGLIIEVIAFAAFAPGDEAFWEGMYPRINLRNIKYVGEGWVEQDGETMYTMGDMVAQVGR